ncbi:MAG TPA: NADH:flavin oxidoreductase [Caulobacteraceae bacterium]|jgi:2,4-dienoyl-CoA reductase-like NADH-dependent reductase (Old Yellow Enzyme family)|nr:NADH:flavin oxidoreductase [Caulobacteraceae bacterium]
MTDLFQPMRLVRGPEWKNRFMLAPLTNLQSHPDGTLSDDEFNWLTYRATGGFGLVMTCASHVQRVGQGFPGQLGIFSDAHLPGLTRLAAKIKAEGAVSSVQLHHAGIRSPKDLIGEAPRGPSEDAETGARALSLGEVEELIEDFVAAAVRAEKAGFDGVELHGAHGYILCAFMSPETNRREDRYGGSRENRARIVFEIIKGVRERTRPDFQLGLRLSPERFGLRIGEQIETAREVLASGDLDYLDMSLWDVFKAPVDEAYAARPLIDWFAELPRGETRLGAAGKLMSGADCRRILEHGADFAILGRAAVLHHDFPQKVAADPDFHAIALPVTRQYLRNEHLGRAMIEYMNGWKGFVADQEVAEAAV